MVAGSCLNVLSNLFWLESKTEHAGRIPFRLTPEHASDLLKGLEFGQSSGRKRCPREFQPLDWAYPSSFEHTRSTSVETRETRGDSGVATGPPGWLTTKEVKPTLGLDLANLETDQKSEIDLRR